MSDTAADHWHVCPASHARWLVTPARRLVQSPRRLLRGLVAEGDTAIDLGCGPGYFTLPLARLVGRSGSVIAIDLQPKMLALLDERARRAGLAARIRTYACSATTLGVVATADFALAVCMVHEVPDAASFLREVHGLLRPGGRLLLVEPRIHVTADGFERTITLTQKAGFRLLSRPRRAFSRAALFERLS